MSLPTKTFFRSFSTCNIRYGKRNFKNFILYNRGTNQFRKQQEENPNKDFQITDYGIRDTTVRVGRKVITVREKIPDIIVPDLDDFNLKPYVSYRAPEITQSEFTAKDLFNAVYRKKIVDDFKNNKLKENFEPIEPNEEESLTPEQAKLKARQTGSDMFSQGR
ncbi:39S ribosomal protein L41, mitochondrial [Aphis craccivora]|uniref:39S ribosomal protein L41, mitochondrial n=1 Tax=Aphis craccivora TaxID=307492 RepID=A0A6G0YXS0_APHCR|nr:39S ribosomal protein L41, mitochondrial [Aphis craccivora]